MDPACTLRLLLLPLLVVGTAPGDAAPGPLGITGAGPLLAASWPRRSRRATPTRALCPLPRGPWRPSLYFLSRRGPSAPGNLSLPGEVADLLPSPDSSVPPLGNNAEICLLPPDEGPCRARIPSFYYSRYTQSCRPFLYGGCEGNANNFETLAACEEACWRIESTCAPFARFASRGPVRASGQG